jgi:hypothetical protein
MLRFPIEILPCALENQWFGISLGLRYSPGFGWGDNGAIFVFGWVCWRRGEGLLRRQGFKCWEVEVTREMCLGAMLSVEVTHPLAVWRCLCGARAGQFGQASFRFMLREAC